MSNSSYAPVTPGSRTAIVTGASGGIGRAVALRLAADGFAVAVHYSSGKDRAQKTVDAIESAGGRALAARADVVDEREVTDLFEQAQASLGEVGAVVHTAGIARRGPVAEADLSQLETMLRINVFGTFVVAQQAVRHVRKGGSIILFSSVSTRLAKPDYAAYCASRGAIDAMTLSLAREMRGRDVTVNTVAPGYTATPPFLEGKDEVTLAQFAGQAPSERIGTPEEIAAMVSFLAGPGGRWINGQIIHANGGLA